ncbi:MAG: DUF2793 domain-containing protein [Polymorphobacter sp.]
MDETLRHRLPLLAMGQAQKEVTHNEALITIDRQLHPAVLTRGLTVPPAIPAAGDSYIVAPGATGPWAGKADQLALFDGHGWTFDTPGRGCLAWIIDEASFAVFDLGWSVGGWPVTALRIGGHQVLGSAPAAIAAASGGTVVDVEARSSIAAILALLRDQGLSI